MIIGLFLGSAAIVAHYCVNEPSFRWPLLIAAALELGFVPFYTTLACRRLRYIVALIDRELEQGQVEHGVGRAPQFGVWPVLEDTDTPRISFALAAISRFPSLPSGFPVAPPAQAARAAESGCVLPSC